MNYTPLRYPGGKTKAIKYLKNYIPQNTKEICSPFFGGGSFEIFLSSLGIKMYGYDNFYPLICFWKSILKDKNKLYSKILKYYPLNKKTFYYLQKYIHTISDEFEIGAIYYVLNRSSFSGSTLSGGMSTNHPRFTQKSINNILDFNYTFDIQYMDFKDSIQKHDCLIYADPPYLINQKLYGTNGNLHADFDHQLLANILNQKGNFILSYNNCDEIKEMYSEHKFIYPSWNYGMNKNKKSNEILIISKDLNTKI